MKKLLTILCITIILLISIWFIEFQIYVTKNYDGRWYCINSYTGLNYVTTYHIGYKPDSTNIAEAKEYVYKEAKKRRKFKYGF